MSWNLRIVLGLLVLVVILLVVGVVYYNIVRVSKDQALPFDPYPGSQLRLEEKLSAGSDHFYYISTDDPLAIESFYRSRDFECQTLYGDVFENAVRQEGVYIQSTCLLDRSHPLGFSQFTRLTIQPIRAPLQYLDDNPQNQIIGGGTLTGEVIIDIQRQWGNDGLLGG